GSVLLNVTSDQVLVLNGTYPFSNIGILLSSEPNVALPTWIKTVAELWSQGQISDDIFGYSVHYLLKESSTEIPSESQTHLHRSIYIPTWFKNNAGWWADEQISDRDFISGAEYLRNIGIMQMPK